MIYLGIDPGTTESAYVVTDQYEPMYCAKVDNKELRRLLINANIVDGRCAQFLIERPVCHKWSGQEVSDTAIWTGIFLASWPDFNGTKQINRQKVRMHMVGKKANDAKIRAALIERFDSDSFSKTKSGVYKDDGSEWFAGFRSDIWQAYALVVTHLDTIGGK